MLNNSAFEIPKNDGERLLIPPLSEYQRLAAQNAALIKNTRIEGESLETLSRAARSETIKRAVEFTRSLGLEPVAEWNPGAPVIASGHQPSMFHPGVAVKAMVLAKSAALTGAVPVFITVDHDEIDASSPVFPTIRDGRLVKAGHLIFPLARGGSLENSGVEPWDTARKRLDGALRLMNFPRLNGPRRAMEEFMRRVDDRPPENAGVYAELAIFLRRAWDRPVNGGYLELPVSLICRTTSFLRWSASIMADIKRFASIYNAELELYRKEHGLRYPANPFPNLERRGDLWEAPFWIGAGGKREKLYVTAKRRAVSESGSLEAPVDEIPRGVLPVRPRAITLSLFMRLFICDLFIHGVGGAKYDRVTDGIIRGYYRVTPPKYAVVSATLHPDIPAEDPSLRIEEIKTRLRSIEQHPEREPELASSPLKREKDEMVMAMSRADADRRTIGLRIKELNRLMAGQLKPLTDALNSELSELDGKWREWDAKSFRDYPFFIYPPQRMADMVTGEEV